MKIMNSKWIFSIACCLLIYGCYTPMEYFENGDYKMAYNKSMNKLIENKDVEENKLVLCKALDKLVQMNENKANLYLQHDDLRKKEKAISQYDANISLLNKSKVYTDGKYDQILKESIVQKMAIKESLYRAYFERGESNLETYHQNKTKVNAQQAYYAFVNAKKFSLKSEQLDSLITVSKHHGTVRIGYTISHPSGAVGLSLDIDKIFEGLENNSGRFQSWTSHNIRVPAHFDCRIHFDFGWLDIDEDSDSDEEEYEEEIEEDDKEIEVHATVFKTVNEREISLDMTMEVNGNKNCSLSNERFSKSIKEVATKTYFKGDKRALPAFYSSKNEKLRDEDEATINLIKAMFADVCEYID